MNKKIKFVAVLCLLLFARGCDFYSTSLWIFQENGLESETNPLTQLFGVGWNGHIILNVLIISLIAFCYYNYIFKYTIKDNLKFLPETTIQYASILYYGKKDQLLKLIYKIPNNKSAAIAHTGYIAIWGIIIASFIATLHNLLQYYDNPYYANYLEFVRFPKLIFYMIIFSPITILTLNLYRNEFQQYKNLRNSN